MIRAAPLAPLALLAVLATPALAEQKPLPPGLLSARLLPGWQTETGSRMAALELVLKPGWKTYWRVPGDTGIPPDFDWSEAANVGSVTYYWPAPEIIESAGEQTLGYHDRLVLPFEVQPDRAARPVDLTGRITFGLCENICVPAELTLTAPPAGNAPDPAIETALAQAPETLAEQPACRTTDIEDGLRVSVSLPQDAVPDAVALELEGRPDVWVSRTEIADDGTVAADFVPADAKPFDLDETALVVTLISDGRAAEMRGCAPRS